MATESAACYRIDALNNQMQTFTDGTGNDGLAFEGIVGSSRAVIDVINNIKTVAPTDCTVLIEGETGTGKELVARAIHRNSPRSAKPFVKINCAAIPAGLLESELFGHERGAFTGAINRRTGRFEAAHQGTLFLDEIGDMPLELQAKLLRVLQEHEFERLGSTLTQRVDVRVVAATNHNLAELAAENNFRLDLYYRLNVFPIEVPPLRARTSDIPSLVEHFVGVFSAKLNRRIARIPPETMEALVRYPWPGNIRELQNSIERAIIFSRGEVLMLQPLPEIPAPSREPQTLEEAERQHILKALRATNWVVGGPSGAAHRLGKKRTTLIHTMRRLGIGRATSAGI